MPNVPAGDGLQVMGYRLWVVVLAAAALAGCHSSEAHGRQVIVLGVDGMDPGFLERHWSELPNVARLRDRGSFRRLGTTTPPQSPVAWSTFITGMGPVGIGTGPGPPPPGPSTRAVPGNGVRGL